MLVRLLICLLLSVAAGAAVYLTGAIVWCLVDPLGAGQSLMVTLPLALSAVAAPAMLGVLGMINTNGWRQNARAMPEARRKVARTPASRAELSAKLRQFDATAAKPQAAPESTPRPDRRQPRDRLRRVGLGRVAPAGVPDADEEIVTA